MEPCTDCIDPHRELPNLENPTKNLNIYASESQHDPPWVVEHIMNREEGRGVEDGTFGQGKFSRQCSRVLSYIMNLPYYFIWPIMEGSSEEKSITERPETNS